MEVPSAAGTAAAADDGGNNNRMVSFKPSPVTLWKALKNPVELEGMRAAHLRDGAFALLDWVVALGSAQPPPTKP